MGARDPVNIAFADHVCHAALIGIINSQSVSTAIRISRSTKQNKVTQHCKWFCPAFRAS